MSREKTVRRARPFLSALRPRSAWPACERPLVSVHLWASTCERPLWRERTRGNRSLSAQRWTRWVDPMASVVITSLASLRDLIRAEPMQQHTLILFLCIFFKVYTRVDTEISQNVLSWKFGLKSCKGHGHLLVNMCMNPVHHSLYVHIVWE